MDSAPGEIVPADRFLYDLSSPSPRVERGPGGEVTPP
jgi:hypothetical protein